MGRKQHLLKLKKERNRTRAIGLCCLIGGYALVMILTISAGPEVAFPGMIVLFVGIVMTMRGFLHAKYKDLNKQLAECQDDDDAPAPTAERRLDLGTFSFSAHSRNKLKAVTVHYMPDNLSCGASQKQVLEMLAPVMELAIIRGRTDGVWDIPEDLPEEERKNRLLSAVVGTILMVDKTLSFSKPKSLKDKVASASQEELLKAWIALDYYADLIKPELTANIQHFRDYIQDTILSGQKAGTTAPQVLPIRFEGENIYIDSAAFLEWKRSAILTPQFEQRGVLPLTKKEPVISLYEDGVKTREYCLQTEGSENFTGKYFLISVRLGTHGSPSVPVAQIDGFISDTPEDRSMKSGDIGYRMEGHFLACGGDAGKMRYEMARGQDLPMKALKYPGYTTPSSVRLMGICPDCGKSFCFHGYAFYMGQSDVAYSDDGLDCCEIREFQINKETWVYETEGKTFRYYNSFNCPHCGSPYIDYKKHPQNKVFGVSGCVHLGRKVYIAQDSAKKAP